MKVKDGQNTKKGDTILYHDRTRMTYDKAKERCQELNAIHGKDHAISLVEIWTEHQWNEVYQIEIMACGEIT